MPDHEFLAARNPRFRVGHLQIWILGFALGFGAYQAIKPAFTPRTYPLGLAYNLMMGVSFGTILSGGAILSARRWRGDPQTPMLPGHWLLEFGLAAALADGAAILLYSLVRGPYDNPPIAYWTPFHMAKSPNLTEVYHQATGWGLGVLASLAFCWHLRRRLPWHWLAVFLGFLLAAMILAGGHLLTAIQVHRTGNIRVIGQWCRRSVHVYGAAIGLCALAVLAAAIWDLRRRSSTDGLHWLGICAWLAIALIQIIIYKILF